MSVKVPVFSQFCQYYIYYQTFSSESWKMVPFYFAFLCETEQFFMFSDHFFFPFLWVVSLPLFIFYWIFFLTHLKGLLIEPEKWYFIICVTTFVLAFFLFYSLVVNFFAPKEMHLGMIKFISWFLYGFWVSCYV